MPETPKPTDGISDSLSDEDLAALERLEKAATPGPWEPSFNVDPPKDENWSSDNEKREGRGEGPNHVGKYGTVQAAAVADSELIAAARNALPKLLAEVRRERAARREAEAAGERIREACWFIERKSPNPGRWLAGFNYDNPIWVDDPDKAIRFVRKQDAASLCTQFSLFTGIGEALVAPFPSEHVFLAQPGTGRGEGKP